MYISASNKYSDRINCKIHILPTKSVEQIKFGFFFFFKVAMPQAKVCVALRGKSENGLCKTCSQAYLCPAPKQ